MNQIIHSAGRRWQKLWYPGIWDGKKWKQRVKMEGKISLIKGKNGVIALNKVKNGPNRT